MKRIFWIGLLMVITNVVIPSNVMVTWEHPGGSNTISGYNIYYGPASQTYTNFVSVGYTTNVIISNFPPSGFISGKTIAPDSSESEFGNEIAVSISPSNTLPSMVKDFVITKVTPTIY